MRVDRRIQAGRRAPAPPDLPVHDDRARPRGARNPGLLHAARLLADLSSRTAARTPHSQVCRGPEPAWLRRLPGRGGRVRRGTDSPRPRRFARSNAPCPRAVARPLRTGATRLAGAVASADAAARTSRDGGWNTCGASCRRSRISWRRRGTCATASSRSACRPIAITVAEYGVRCAARVRRIRSGARRRPHRPAAPGFPRQPDGLEGAAPAARSACARLPPGSVTVDLFGAHTAYHGDDSYRRAARAAARRQPGVRAHGPLAARARRMTRCVDSTSSSCRRFGPRTARSSFARRFSPAFRWSRRGSAAFRRPSTTGSTDCCSTPATWTISQRVLARLLDEPGLLPALRRGIPARPDDRGRHRG